MEMGSCSTHNNNTWMTMFNISYNLPSCSIRHATFLPTSGCGCEFNICGSSISKKNIWIRIPMLNVADPGCSSRFSEPETNQRIKVFLTQKFDTKYSKIWSGIFIADSGFGLWIFVHPGSRIQGFKSTGSRIQARNTSDAKNAKYHEQICNCLSGSAFTTLISLIRVSL